MTLREIESVLTHYHKQAEDNDRYAWQRAAFVAYFGGYYSRPNVKLPESLVRAFPSLFGRSESGGIKAENWQEGERALMQIARSFQSKKKAVKK